MKEYILLALVLFSTCLCSCFPSDNLNTSSLGNITYVDNSGDFTGDSLTIDNGFIKGNLSENISVKVKNVQVDQKLCPLEFKYNMYTEEQIINTFFNNKVIVKKTSHDDEILNGYKNIFIKSDDAFGGSSAGEIRYETNKIESNNIFLILRGYKTNIRDDIKDIFSKNIPNNLNTENYIKRTDTLLAELNILNTSSPTIYYIDKDSLSLENDNMQNDSKTFNDNYILIVYDNFQINNRDLNKNPISWNFAGSWFESYFFALINTSNNEIELLQGTGLYDLNSIKETSSCSPVISINDAIIAAACEYNKKITQKNTLISDAILNYVPIIDNNQTLLIPAWAITITSKSQMWNEKIQQYSDYNKESTIFVNALNGKVML